MLTPSQALAYVRARYSLGNGSDLERITRQQAFVSSLITRAKGELLDPLAIYRFLNAATGSLTIDSQLGGISGLYSLAQSLRGIPASKIAMFTLPNFPRADIVPSDTANVLWKQPEDGEIFASFRNDLPASSTLFATTTTTAVAEGAAAGRPGKFGVLPTASPRVRIGHACLFRCTRHLSRSDQHLVVDALRSALRRRVAVGPGHVMANIVSRAWLPVPRGRFVHGVP